MIGTHQAFVGSNELGAGVPVGITDAHYNGEALAALYRYVFNM